jgi:hypothetical protein
MRGDLRAHGRRSILNGMRVVASFAAVFLLAGPGQAIEVCAPTPVYEPCEISLDMTEEEAAKHANPYMTVELRAEFRSPKGGATKVMPGFWDGGRNFKLRFAPDFEGRWDFRIISNLPSVDRKVESFEATPARTPGFIEVFNTRYFRHQQENTPHFWIGDTSYKFATIPWETFQQVVDRRSEQKFNHIRGLILGFDEHAEKVLADPENPLLLHFQEVDRRVAYMNQKGIIYDLLMGGDQNQLADLLPKRQQRERYARYLVARYGAYNITWQGVQEFEEYEDGRAFLKEMYGYIQKWDPYNHPRSTHAVTTSSPLMADGWMSYIVQQSSDVDLAAVEYEINAAPFVNAEFGYEDSGAGKSHTHHVDSDEFRRRMWRAAIHGQYITYGNTGTYGGRKFDVDPRFLDSPGVEYVKHLQDFLQQTRYFDLQPYYRVEGGEALGLQVVPYRSEKPMGVEYIVYVEKPGPVELIIPKHKYDVSWFNPIDGAWFDQKDRFNGERFRSPGPPDDLHDWVLYVRREGKKENFNNSFYLESRQARLKKVETAEADLPFSIQLPDAEELVAGKEFEFNATLTKDTRAAKKIYWLWTAEVAGSGVGPRVLGSEQFGRFKIPERLTEHFPATLQVRLVGVDGAGRVFEAFKPYRLAAPE